jgi:hypothetical protein
MKKRHQGDDENKKEEMVMTTLKRRATNVKPWIFIENPNPCTIAIVPGSVAIAYRTSHR